MAEKGLLTQQEKKTLLTIARRVLDGTVCNGKHFEVDLSDLELTPALKCKCGAFVTLTCGGNLRGCIGYIEGIEPLYETVIANVYNASHCDPRFDPVQPEELGSIEIEISAMTPLWKIDSPEEVIPGTHGVVIERGACRGLLLPQVATEYGWDRETFLSHTCMKACLPSHAWKDKETNIFVFTAEVFNEGELQT